MSEASVAAISRELVQIDNITAPTRWQMSKKLYLSLVEAFGAGNYKTGSWGDTKIRFDIAGGTAVYVQESTSSTYFSIGVENYGPVQISWWYRFRTQLLCHKIRKQLNMQHEQEELDRLMRKLSR